jgi:hypothetical protein
VLAEGAGKGPADIFPLAAGCQPGLLTRRLPNSSPTARWRPSELTRMQRSMTGARGAAAAEPPLLLARRDAAPLPPALLLLRREPPLARGAGAAGGGCAPSSVST